MPRPPVRNKADEAGAYDAAQKVVEVHRRLAAFLAHGQTLAQIDAFVARTLDDLGCKSCFYRYAPGRMPPFPSQACLSVNECVVHGTAGYYTKPLAAGDLLSIDIGVSYRGWIGDAAWTYAFGHRTDETQRLCDAGKESLAVGIEQLRVDRPFIEWAKAVQHCVESKYGFRLIRGLGGHGYGRKLHNPPYISNTVPGPFEVWAEANQHPKPGTLVAVEPMIAVGTGDTRQGSRDWPIYSADNSMSVHYEHDVLITDCAPRILTEGLEQLEDLITR